MRRKLRWIFSFSFLALLGLTLHAISEGKAPSAPRQGAIPSEGDTLPASLKSFAGNLSCSATSCHGAITPRENSEISRNEFTIWLAHDSHKNAYNVLLGDRAKKIAENLGMHDPAKVIPAHKDTRCLACHTTPQAAIANPSDEVIAFHKTQGIACEVCHGPAAQQGKSWLAAHTTTEWKKKSPEEKMSYGMIPISDLSTQSKVCAGCHVGAPPDQKQGIPARDLNHDLMAAGHPRLVFEMNVYRLSLPAHWNIQGKKQTSPEYQAALWAIGQIATAKAQVDLTGYRAGKKEAPWPEFAETGCFACHSDFQLYPDWRLSKNYYGKRTPGDLPYNDWYASMLEPIGKAYDLKTGEFEKAFSDLALAMGRSGSKRSEIVTKAGEVSKLLQSWLSNVSVKSTSREKLLKAILTAKPADQVPSKSWDENMQVILAMAALNQDLYFKQAKGEALSADQKKIVDQLNALMAGMAYPEGAESPIGYHSNMKRASLKQQIADLFGALK